MNGRPDPLKKSARNVPVAISTTNAYRATSPSRKDQWSGNTLRSAIRA